MKNDKVKERMKMNKKQKLLDKLHMTEQQMSECIEDSLVNYYEVLTKVGNRKFELTKEYGWVDTAPTTWSNCVFYLNTKEVETRIHELKQRMMNGEIPKEWLIGPKSRPTELGTYLEKEGFSKYYFMTGMAIDLEEDDFQVEDTDEFQIIDVTTEEQMKVWTKVVSEALWNGRPFEAELFIPLMNRTDFKFYLGYWRGEPVTTSMILLVNEVATVDMISTMPSARKQGFGTLMVQKVLQYAKNMKFQFAVLQASQSGRPVYRKMGFEEFCEFYDYRLVDET